MSSPRYLSGIQPSGVPHLGNYFGALVQHVERQAEGNAFYFVANYHALTSIRDPDVVRELTHDVALTYLALGLDPERATLFRQSDVPEVTELAWLLSTVTPMGLLERAVAYKDKVARGQPANAGLFTYPVLQAADILGYDAQRVPVGGDQVQHLEITRDIAGAFNNAYGDVFLIPEAELNHAPLVPGTDGAKMSKSYGNHIPIFARGKELKKLVMSIQTDSTAVADPKDPDSCNVFALYSLFATPPERAELAQRYRQGGIGYGEVKKMLLSRIEEHFAEAHARRDELVRDPDLVADVLAEGAKRARRVAREVTDRARSACGVD